MPPRASPYELDEDGLPRELVGTWAKEKYERLRRYVDISRAVRRKFSGTGKPGTTYIDLFCGPGRVRIRETDEVLPGGPLQAWGESVAGDRPFTNVYVADHKKVLVDAAATRLSDAGSNVEAYCGEAEETVDKIAARLNPYALHFTFLDPYNLNALPFTVLSRLSNLERMDILIHVSLQDLQRNLRRYLESNQSPFDRFAPGWRAHVDVNQHDDLVRGELMRHWTTLLENEGMTTAKSVERVAAGKNQPLYWLAFAARHQRALEFWEKICALDNQGELF